MMSQFQNFKYTPTRSLGSVLVGPLSSCFYAKSDSDPFTKRNKLKSRYDYYPAIIFRNFLKIIMTFKEL